MEESENVSHTLVTGAAGFIGYHVARKLLERGDQVVGLDNMNDYYDPSLKEARVVELARGIAEGDPISAAGAMKDTVLTHKGAVSADARRRLALLVGKYLG